MRRASGFTSNKTKFAAREKLGGFKADICSSSLVWGPERKQPGLLCQGASCLNLCQLICRCGLIARRTSQPLQPNGTVICRFISQLAAKTWWHRTSESGKEEEGGREGLRKGGESETKSLRLESVLAVNTVKSPKVYCLSICQQSKERLNSPRKPQKAL